MAGTYLASNKFAVPIEPSRYRGRWQIMGREFFINDLCLSVHEARPQLVPASCTTAYKLKGKDEAEIFHDFLQEWMSNGLTLYRGFSGCHFCWPKLLEGTLESEGKVDYPEFTMSDSGKGTTCWLPTAGKKLAEGCSIQDIDPFTDALSRREPVPVGFAVKIPAGSSRNLPLCWLNTDEIVVKGPLIGQFELCSIAWYHVGQVSFRPWPTGIGRLFMPPQRPYKPGSQNLIDAWWRDPSMQLWLDEVAKVDIVYQKLSGRVAQPTRKRADAQTRK
jgi:hypothetical protein